MEWVDNLGLYAIPAFAVLMAVEFCGYHVEKRKAGAVALDVRRLNLRDTAANLGTYGIGTLAAPLDKLLEYPILAGAAMLTPLALEPSQWWVWVLAIFMADVTYYFSHRLSHRVRLFWAGHAVHHSSQHFNMSTALRLPWLVPGQSALASLYTPMVLIGIPLWMVFLGQAVVLLYQFPLHTQQIGRLPKIIEYVFNTPSHHRAHHGANNPYLDKNYGGILIVWDRLFGTYVDEIEQVRYGLTKNVAGHNLVVINYHEFVQMITEVWRAPSWKVALDQVLRPPGQDP